MSPGTRSSAVTSRSTPPRRTRAPTAERAVNSARARSVRTRCTPPTSAEVAETVAAAVHAGVEVDEYINLNSRDDGGGGELVRDAWGVDEG